MNALLGQIMNNFIMGKLNNIPQMQSFNQMMSGKTTDQQIQTLLNMAKSRGFDVNAKMFSEEDLKSFGLNSSALRRGVD